MSVVIDFPTIPPPPSERDDFHRLHRALAKMLNSEGEDLVKLLHEIIETFKGRDLLTGAFACLVVAEMFLLRLPEVPFDERLFVRLRSFAIDIAERMVELQSASSGPAE